MKNEQRCGESQGLTTCIQYRIEVLTRAFGQERGTKRLHSGKADVKPSLFADLEYITSRKSMKTIITNKHVQPGCRILVKNAIDILKIQ